MTAINRAFLRIFGPSQNNFYHLRGCCYACNEINLILDDKNYFVSDLGNEKVSRRFCDIFKQLCITKQTLRGEVRLHPNLVLLVIDLKKHLIEIHQRDQPVVSLLVQLFESLPQ